MASFDVSGDIANVRSMVFDTDTMLIRGGGGISLRNETLNLNIEDEPKEPRLVRFGAPISIEGRWRSPEVGVNVGEAITEGGLAAALGTPVGPSAAILPFIDAGLAEDENYAALLSGRETERREG